jgi:exodeoxyribonuclease V alpha subunit
MQIENDYDKEVYNGDIGTIDDVDSNAGEIVASFDGRSVTYGFGELDMLAASTPRYAAPFCVERAEALAFVILHFVTLVRPSTLTGLSPLTVERRTTRFWSP